MNQMEDVIQYIKEQRPNISPKKLRYALYLLYADYLTATEDGYDELFNHNFYTAYEGPMPEGYTSEFVLYDTDGNSSRLDPEIKDYIDEALSKYYSLPEMFLETISSQSLDCIATWKHCKDCIKIIPKELICLNQEYNRIIYECFEGK
jgi:hypothetical protein